MKSIVYSPSCCSKTVTSVLLREKYFEKCLFFFLSIQWKSVGSNDFWTSMFLTFYRRMKVIQVWNDMRASKWLNFHFWVNCPFKSPYKQQINTGEISVRTQRHWIEADTLWNAKQSDKPSQSGVWNSHPWIYVPSQNVCCQMVKNIHCKQTVPTVL